MQKYGCKKMFGKESENEVKAIETTDVPVKDAEVVENKAGEVVEEVPNGEGKANVAETIDTTIKDPENHRKLKNRQ